MSFPDAPSQTSDRSSVVDLSCTYKISQNSSLQETSPTSWEEDFCSTLTSPSSLPSQRNTGSRTFFCDDNEELLLEEEKKSPFTAQSSDALLVPRQSAATLNSLQKPETTQGLHDGKIRARLDAFYEQSFWRGKNETLSQQFQEKISDLSKKKHFYALRSFQLGKIVLNREGDKVLQSPSSKDSFSSRGVKCVQPVPGLSDDVVRFIMNQTSTSHS